MSYLRNDLFDWLQQHPQQVTRLSITQIADILNSTPSTITKTLISNGYSGYKEYKFAVSRQGQDSSSLAADIEIEAYFSKAAEILKKSHTQESMAALATAVRSADEVIISGIGHSMEIAMHLKRRIVRRFGKKAAIANETYLFGRKPDNAVYIFISLDLGNQFLSEVIDLPAFSAMNSFLLTSSLTRHKRAARDRFLHKITINNELTRDYKHDTEFEPAVRMTAMMVAIDLFLH